MLCSDTTGSLPAVRIPGVKVRDLEEFGLQEYLSSCRLIREHPQAGGNGNILIEIFQGFVSRIVASASISRKRERNKPRVN